jgi:hypothetical protein
MMGRRPIIKNAATAKHVENVACVAAGVTMHKQPMVAVAKRKRWAAVAFALPVRRDGTSAEIAVACFGCFEGSSNRGSVSHDDALPSQRRRRAEIGRHHWRE